MTRQRPAGMPALSESKVSQANDLPSIRDHSDRNEDPQQVALFGVPRARGHINPTDGTLVTDPATLRAAAESLSLPTVNRLQRVALNAFRLARQPLSDEQLISEIHRQFPSVRATDSSWRTRRRELERGGMVELVDEAGVTASGRACRRFRAVTHDVG
jgi:hypothetical protein